MVKHERYAGTLNSLDEFGKRVTGGIMQSTFWMTAQETEDYLKRMEELRQRIHARNLLGDPFVSSAPCWDRSEPEDERERRTR